MPMIQFLREEVLVGDFMQVTNNQIRDAHGQSYCPCTPAPDILPQEYTLVATFLEWQATQKIKHFKGEYLQELLEPQDPYYRGFLEMELRDEQISLDPREWGEI